MNANSASAQRTAHPIINFRVPIPTSNSFLLPTSDFPFKTCLSVAAELAKIVTVHFDSISDPLLPLSTATTMRLPNPTTTFCLIASAIFSLLIPTTLFAQTELPTIDEALELSRKSGVPIFAMAGRET